MTLRQLGDHREVAGEHSAVPGQLHHLGQQNRQRLDLIGGTMRGVKPADYRERWLAGAASLRPTRDHASPSVDVHEADHVVHLGQRP